MAFIKQKENDFNDNMSKLTVSKLKGFLRFFPSQNIRQTFDEYIKYL